MLFIKLFKIGFVPKTNQTSFNINPIERVEYKDFDYGEYKIVKLLHTQTR